ncbi:MAG: NUDIX domain-containing protein [bacterium]|nr:NUDIX domain-containing protein [bacterium]
MSLNACKLVTGVALILKKENKILLFKRNIPGKIAFGAFALPGGTVENNETVKHTACREAAEEIGIEIAEKDVSIVHVLRLREKYDAFTNITNQILMLYFAEISQWSGDPHNLEPHKHSDLGWYDMHNLPENLFSHNKQALHHINKGIFYNEHGWE